MPREFRNSFNAGVISDTLEARADLRKWKASLLIGDNVILLPQGGVKRRPGTKYVATVGTDNRIRRFKVGYDTQYLLVFFDGVVEVWSTDDERITTIETPWDKDQIQEIAFAQAADTMIVFHEDVAPHRLFRALAGTDPLSTTNDLATVTVTLADHGLLTGDKIGISGATATGGIAAEDLAAAFEVTTFGGNLGTNPIASTSGSTRLTATITGHGLSVGQRFSLNGLSALRGTSGGSAAIDIIPAVELNRIQTVATVPNANSVTFDVVTTAAATVAAGGGTGGTWKAVDKFTIDAPTVATSTTTGGGSAVYVWTVTSIAPDEDRKVALKNLPRFDFKDALSPAPANEQQRLIFDNFSTGDRYKLLSSGALSDDAKDESGKISYEADNDDNAVEIQEALNEAYGTTGIQVEFERTDGTEDYYLVTFAGDAALTDWGLISNKVTNSTSGTITVEEVSTGGSTAEPAMSDARGWPRAGVFHQRRLWMVAPKSRPITVYASVTEDFYNFDVGQAQPSDAIDSTGEFDPIRHIVVAQKGLHLITTGSVINIIADRDTGGFIPPLAYERGDNYGGSDVAPAVLAGLPCYVDVIERSIRQIRYDVNRDSIVSAEISQFAQDLISNPIRMETIRNSDGDYLYVVNEDGTIACLCLDVAQGVSGWTKFSNFGGYGFYDLAEVGGYMYVTVDRYGGRYLEKFDPEYFTDAGLKLSGTASSDWTGATHLEGAADIWVRGDEQTLDTVTPTTSGDFSTSVAGVPEEVSEVEIGFPFVVQVRPTPMLLGRRTRLIACTVDLLDSREVRVGNYPVTVRASSNLGLVPLATGFYRVPLRGWGQRVSVTIRQVAPQPMLLRGLELEAA